MQKEIYRNRIAGANVPVVQVAYLEVDEYRFPGEEPSLVTVKTFEGETEIEKSTFLIAGLEAILKAAKEAAADAN